MIRCNPIPSPPKLLASRIIDLLKHKSPQRGKETSMEALYGHLPITPFHGGLQKVKGKVDEFTELEEKRCLPNALMRVESQEITLIFC